MIDLSLSWLLAVLAASASVFFAEIDDSKLS
jgi:hypothetical protein